MNIHLGAYSDELFALVVHYGGKIHQLPTMITSRLLLQVIYWSLIRAGLLKPPKKIRKRGFVKVELKTKTTGWKILKCKSAHDAKMFDEVFCSQPVHCCWCHRQVMLTWQESNRNSKITKKSFKSKIKINKLGLDNEKPSWILSYNNMLWLVVCLSLIPFSYFATHSSKRPHFIYFRLILTADLSICVQWRSR